MPNEVSDSSFPADGGAAPLPDSDLEKQPNLPLSAHGPAHPSSLSNSSSPRTPALVAVVVSTGDAQFSSDAVAKSSKVDDSPHVPSPRMASPKKEHLSRTTSSNEECRVCQQEKEERLVDLGCQCRGGLAKAHQSCIETWFRAKGSNMCEICQAIAVNIPAPESQPSTNYWVWRMDPTFRSHEHERGCVSPIWVAFSILIGGLLLDVLISMTLGVSALPVNIIIGVIVVLGLGTALRLGVEFCHEWRLRRLMQRVGANTNAGQHPAL